MAAPSFNDKGKLQLMEILSRTLVTMIPKAESELFQFQKSIEKSCSDFENRCVLLGWVSNETGDCNALSAVVSDLNRRFTELKRRDVLSRARELLLSDYHNTMLGTGDAQEDEPSSAGDIGDPRAILENSGSFNMQALRFEPCQVSLATCRLLKLAHEVMKQACTSSPSVSETLYHSARDCFELFIAVVPSKFSDVIDTVPRMGAVFYNDCAYLCHNCTLMTHAYRQDIGKVDPLLKDAVGFIDYIPRLRVLGEACLSSHLEEQKKSLGKLFARINLSVNQDSDIDSTEEGGENDVAAASALVRHVDRLRGQWNNVLQDSVYVKLASHLVEGSIRAAMKPIIESVFISEKAGADVSRVFRTLQNMRFAFPDVQTDNDVNKIVASWDKFCALTDLLEYSLNDISDSLPK